MRVYGTMILLCECGFAMLQERAEIDLQGNWLTIAKCTNLKCPDLGKEKKVKLHEMEAV